jgi:hypothetical protein
LPRIAAGLFKPRIKASKASKNLALKGVRTRELQLLAYSASKNG